MHPNRNKMIARSISPSLRNRSPPRSLAFSERPFTFEGDIEKNIIPLIEVMNRGGKINWESVFNDLYEAKSFKHLYQVLQKGAPVDTQFGKPGMMSSILEHSVEDQEMIAFDLAMEFNPRIENSYILYQAVESGNIVMVQRLIDAGASPIHGPTRDTAPICGLLRNGHINVAKLLIAHGANPNDIMETKKYERIADFWRMDLLKLFLANGLDVSTDHRLLEHAVYNRDYPITELLLMHGARFSNWHFAICKMVPKHNVSLDVEDSNDRHMFQLIMKYAMNQPNSSESSYFLNVHYNPNEADHDPIMQKFIGMTPLAIALTCNYHMVRVLLEAGASPFDIDSEGNDAFSFESAMAENLDEVTDCLGTRIPYEFVVKGIKKGFHFFVESIGKNGVDLNGMGSSHNISLLEVAIRHCEENFIEIMKALLAAGVDPNLAYGDSKPPLQILIRERRSDPNFHEVYQTMIAYGAKERLINTTSKSATFEEDDE